jgi:hypothetical protein
MQCTTTAKQHGSTGISSHNPTTCVAATAQVIAISHPILLLLLVSSSSSSPDSHPKEALMISISSTAPPRKKESYCQLFKHSPFSIDKTTTTTTTQQTANPKPAFLPSFLPSFRNTSTKLHRSKAITGSIKQAPNLSYKKSVSEQATAARARNHHQNKTKTKQNTVAGKPAFIPLVSGLVVVGKKPTTTTSVTIVGARCEQIRNSFGFLHSFHRHYFYINSLLFL